jgi:hypothetical protein
MVPATQTTSVTAPKVPVTQTATQTLPTNIPVLVAPVSSSTPLTATLSNEDTDLLNDVIVSNQPIYDTSLVQTQQPHVDANWDPWEAHTNSQQLVVYNAPMERV